MAHRTEQIESALMRAVGNVLAEGLADPRYRGLVTVTGVTLSHDKREASVGISVLPAEHESSTLAALEHATPHIRSRVMQRVRYRQMPRLIFQLDPTIKRQARVLGAINQAMNLSGPGLADQTDRDTDSGPHPDGKDSNP